MQRRVIFVNRFFYPDLSATSQMLGDLAFTLAERGFEVSVIASRISYEKAQGPRLSARECIKGVDVCRVWSTSFGRKSNLGRLFDYFSFHIAATYNALGCVQRGDVLIAKTDPPLISVSMAWVAKRKGAQLVNWLQDLFPEVLEAAIGKKDRAVWLDLLCRVRNKSLRSAKLNVVVGELMSDRLLGEGIASSRVRVIPNWSDRTRVWPVAASANSLRREWALDGKFVVGYSGNLGVAHDFAIMLGAAKALVSYSEIAFVFIGGGSQHLLLKESAVRARLNNLQFRPYQPDERLAESLSVPDVHLICLRPEMEGLIVPSKLYGIFAAGRPCVFIGHPTGEVPRILSALKCGECVTSADELASTIVRLASDISATRALGAQARIAFEQGCDRVHAVDKWAAVLSGF